MFARFAEVSLEGCEFGLLLRREEGETTAGIEGARGPSYAVYVLVRGGGEVQVYYVIYTLEVYTPGYVRFLVLVVVTRYYRVVYSYREGWLLGQKRYIGAKILITSAWYFMNLSYYKRGIIIRKYDLEMAQNGRAVELELVCKL